MSAKRIVCLIILLTSVMIFAWMCKSSSVIIGTHVINQEKINSEQLKGTVKVLVKPNNVGSGTIIYYDKTRKIAYVASAGHLWTKEQKCDIEYLGKKYPATILFSNRNPSSDCSLIQFKPISEPEYFPIAPEGYSLSEGQQYYSIGCDYNTSPTRYFVEYVGLRRIVNVKEPVVTTMYNSPKPGRSGGGLLDSNYLVGICFGTQSRDGAGYGFFTPLQNIRRVFRANRYDWLLNVAPEHPVKQMPSSDHYLPLAL